MWVGTAEQVFKVRGHNQMTASYISMLRHRGSLVFLQSSYYPSLLSTLPWNKYIRCWDLGRTWKIHPVVLMICPINFTGGGGAKSTKLHCTVWPWSPLSHRLFEMRQFIYLKSKTNPMPSTNLCLATFPNSVHFTLRTTCEKLAIFSLEMQLWCEQRTK